MTLSYIFQHFKNVLQSDKTTFDVIFFFYFVIVIIYDETLYNKYLLAAPLRSAALSAYGARGATLI